jgi:hypothetical protein
MIDRPRINARFAAALRGDEQADRDQRLAEHAGGVDAATVEVIGDMTGRQGEQQGGNKLEQADQPKIPGAASDVVHLPADSDHQHLVGDHADKARAGEKGKGAVLEELREVGAEHGRWELPIKTGWCIAADDSVDGFGR